MIRKTAVGNPAAVFLRNKKSKLFFNYEPQANKKFFGAAVFQKCCRGVGEQPTFAEQIEQYQKQQTKFSNPLKSTFQEMQFLQKSEKIEKLLLQSRNFVNFLTTDHEIWYNKRIGRKISFLFSGEHLAEPPEISIRIERT